MDMLKVLGSSAMEKLSLNRWLILPVFRGNTAFAFIGKSAPAAGQSDVPNIFVVTINVAKIFEALVLKSMSMTCGLIMLPLRYPFG